MLYAYEIIRCPEIQFNIGHIGVFVVNQRIRNLPFLKKFPLLLPEFFSCKSMAFGFSNALSTMKLSFEHADIHDFEIQIQKLIF